MTVHKIENISRQESPVQYRRAYTADVLFEHVGSPEDRVPIEFTIEDTAASGSVISFRFLDTPDYPLVPARRAVEEHLRDLQSQGEFV